MPTVTRRRLAAGIVLAFLSPGLCAAADARWDGPRSLGQRLYVPVYASVPYLDGRLFELAVTISIRNTDERHPIRLEAVRYYDSRGEPKRGATPLAGGSGTA